MHLIREIRALQRQWLDFLPDEFMAGEFPAYCGTLVKRGMRARSTSGLIHRPEDGTIIALSHVVGHQGGRRTVGTSRCADLARE